MSQGVGLIRPLPPDGNVHIIIHLNNTMNILRNFQKGKIKPETLNRIFLEWFLSLLQNAEWRAYVRRKLEESELPVIEFTGREDRRVVK